MAKKLYGAVVVFKEGMSRPEVERTLLRMTDDAGFTALGKETCEALAEGRCVEGFDPDEGGPVWYIP